jgi:hypothetical protein
MVNVNRKRWKIVDIYDETEREREEKKQYLYEDVQGYH